MTEQLIGKLGYLGIALILILGGLGLPIPEEAPIIVAAVLSRNGTLTWPLALGSCLSGVLLGDMVVYSLGYFYGEKVLSLPLTRKLLTRRREAEIKGYFHRHGFKILLSGRFVPGFRTAAYLTAGILKLPPVSLLLTDLVAATLSTFFFFGLAYAFAYQIQQGIREVQQWVLVGVAVGVLVWLAHSLLPGKTPLRQAGRSAGSGRRRRSAFDRSPIKHPSPADFECGERCPESGTHRTGDQTARASTDEPSPPDSTSRQSLESRLNFNHDGVVPGAARPRTEPETRKTDGAGRNTEGGGRRAEGGERKSAEEVGARES